MSHFAHFSGSGLQPWQAQLLGVPLHDNALQNSDGHALVPHGPVVRVISHGTEIAVIPSLLESEWTAAEIGLDPTFG